MTRIFILFFISSLSVFDTSPDLGSCIRYHVKIYLTSEKTVEGIIQHATYQPKFKFSDSEFRIFLESIAYTDSVIVYSEIHTISQLIQEPNGHNCIPELYAIAPEDVISIPYAEIHTAHLIKYEPCDNCASNDEKTGFSFNGPTTILELSKKEIMFMQHQSEAHYDFWYPEEMQHELGYGSFALISYNSEVGFKELKETGDRLIREDLVDYKQGANASYPSRQKRYKELKESLRQKNIILFTNDAPP
jgi:hypothetical protein